MSEHSSGLKRPSGGRDYVDQTSAASCSIMYLSGRSRLSTLRGPLVLSLSAAGAIVDAMMQPLPT
ncbi:MAG: hypothetical protein JWN10_1170 [Solirubrobacterales bacterium]|nr:hypothetical protein [Solirubrobacterales bacterium]